MSVTIPGQGVATPLVDLLANYQALVGNLPALIGEHPDARVVRNAVGNLAIVSGTAVMLGWIDVRSGDIVLVDQPGT